MSVRYNIPDLLAAIGIRGYLPRASSALNRAIRANNEIEYQESIREATKEITGYDNVEILETDDLGSGPGQQFEGLPIWMPLELRSKDGSLQDLLLDSAIVSINRPKNIVKTEIQGRDGTVKEFISKGDYQISVSGILATGSYRYPKEAVGTLHRFFDLNTPIEVVSEVLNNVGIYEIVIEDHSLPHTPHINCQQYSFSAVSDTPIELTI